MQTSEATAVPAKVERKRPSISKRRISVLGKCPCSDKRQGTADKDSGKQTIRYAKALASAPVRLPSTVIPRDSICWRRRYGYFDTDNSFPSGKDPCSDTMRKEVPVSIAWSVRLSIERPVPHRVMQDTYYRSRGDGLKASVPWFF